MWYEQGTYDMCARKDRNLTQTDLLEYSKQAPFLDLNCSLCPPPSILESTARVSGIRLSTELDPLPKLGLFDEFRRPSKVKASDLKD